jgi:hypothetical protein
MLAKTVLDSTPAWFTALEKTTPVYRREASAGMHWPTILETFQPEKAHRMVDRDFCRYVNIYPLQAAVTP